VLVPIRKNRERIGRLIAWSSLSFVGVSIVILTLLAGDDDPLPIRSTSMSFTAFAQEESENAVGSSGIELSPHPIWNERVMNTGNTPINKTHTFVTFTGNGTMTVPDTGQTINMTNNGTAIVSPVSGSPTTISASGRESVFSEDGDATAITFHEIIQYVPESLQGKGIIIAVFDSNATGTLAPFSGMIVAGTHYENTEEAIITLWEWETGIDNGIIGL
jgi:hypothetical protein